MAYALSNTDTNFLSLSFRLRYAAQAWKAARAKRAVFNRTFNELNRLDDRDLADIGIARDEIRDLAWNLADKPNSRV